MQTNKVIHVFRNNQNNMQSSTNNGLDTCTAIYGVSALLILIALVLVVCRQAKAGTLLSSVIVLILVICVSVPGNEQTVTRKPLPQTKNMNMSRFHTGQCTASTGISPGSGWSGGSVRYQPGADPNTWVPQVHRPEAIAEVPNNAYLGYYAPAPPPPRMTQDSASVPLPVDSEPSRRRQQAVRSDTPPLPLATCGRVEPSGPTTVRNMPPMPGVAQYPGESIWRLPEYPVEEPSRAGTIANVVPGLPEVCQTTPMQIIRNNGLYGIRGNLSADLLKRSAVADFGFLQPLGARDAWIAYNSYDQLHAKDQYLIPATPAPAIHHRQYDPLLRPQEVTSSPQQLL
jgi:hypothetical protein